MKTIITVTILFLTIFDSTALARKTGYCKSFVTNCTSEPNGITLFSVPSDARFVLERLYVSGQDAEWSLNVNSNFSISGILFYYFNVYEFPNETAVFNAEDNVVLSYISPRWPIYLTIIGYFEDTVMSADINGDGKVNMLDFAILSNQWLNGL